MHRELFFEVVKFVLILCFAFACMLAMVAWRRRERSGLLAFSLLSMGVALWCVCFAFELMSTNAASAILWVKMQHLGIQAIPMLWLIFAARYTGQDAWIKRPFYVAAAGIWILSVMMFWTNERHGLVWPRILVDASQVPGMFLFERGPVFWTIVVYDYLLLLAGTVIVVRSILSNRLLSGWNSVPLLVAQMMPWIGNLAFLNSPSILFGVDPTPFFFAVSLGLLGWRLFRYQLLDLVTVERNLVIEEMADGIMVLDVFNRILDVNKAARTIFSIDGRVIGRATQDIIKGGRDLFAGFEYGTKSQFEFDDRETGRRRWYEVSTSLLAPDNNRGLGRILLFRDVTDQKKVEEAEREQRLQAEIFRDTMTVLNSSLEMGEVLERILSNVGRVVPHEAANIMLLDADGLARVELCRGYRRLGGQETLERLHSVVEDFPNLARMRETGQPLAIIDVTMEPGWKFLPGLEWVRSYAAAPVKIKGEVIGFLSLDSSTPGFFTPVHLERLKTFADQAAIAVEKARLFERTQELAVTDPLTGLSNRRLFEELAERELERARRHRQAMACVMIDIDLFKQVNDSFGHLAGDQVLKDVARLLKLGLRSIDILCRFGGEEFAAILPDTGMSDALATAERLRQMVEEEAGSSLPGKRRVTISLGVAEIHPDERPSLDALLGNADKALYSAKREGRNRVMTF